MISRLAGAGRAPGRWRGHAGSRRLRAGPALACGPGRGSRGAGGDAGQPFVDAVAATSGARSTSRPAANWAWQVDGRFVGPGGGPRSWPGRGRIASTHDVAAGGRDRLDDLVGASVEPGRVLRRVGRQFPVGDITRRDRRGSPGSPRSRPPTGGRARRRSPAAGTSIRHVGTGRSRSPSMIRASLAVQPRSSVKKRSSPGTGIGVLLTADSRTQECTLPRIGGRLPVASTHDPNAPVRTRGPASRHRPRARPASRWPSPSWPRYLPAGRSPAWRDRGSAPRCSGS